MSFLVLDKTGEFASATDDILTAMQDMKAQGTGASIERDDGVLVAIMKRAYTSIAEQAERNDPLNPDERALPIASDRFNRRLRQVASL